MTLARRQFLQGLGAGAVSALAGCAAPGTGTPTRRLPDFAASSPDAYWRAVREEYLVEDDPVYLNTGGLGPATRRVLDAVDRVQRKLQEHSETGHSLLHPAREIVAGFLGAHAEELCFTRNATEGNSIIAAGLELRDGDEAIFETHAHPGGSFPWLNQERVRGVRTRLFEPDHGSARANLGRIRALITPRTRVIQVSHITCTTGLVFPVAEIAALARERGIWFHIDGAQSAGMVPVNLHAIGCESYAFSGHKWLGGPLETGGLFIRRDRIPDIANSGAGAYSGDLPDGLPGPIAFFEGASRHEYGTRNAGLIEGLAEAVRFQQQIGPARIAQYGAEMATRLVAELSAIPGISVLTPRGPDLRGSMTTIAHARADAGRLFGYLAGQHHLRCRPVTEQNLNAVRISTHVFNHHRDCDRVIAAVRASAKDL